MIVVKYFHEEPAAWESGAEMPSPGSEGAREALDAFLARPRVYRGYLSASEPGRGISGATGIARPEAWSIPLTRVFPDLGWWTVSGVGPSGQVVAVENPRRFLERAAGTLLVAGSHPPDDALAVRCLEALAESGPSGRGPRLDLALSGCVVFWTEAAFHGVDWALLSPAPVAEAVRSALRDAWALPSRAFVIPFREARSEHRFHFDRYDPGLFGAYEVQPVDRGGS